MPATRTAAPCLFQFLRGFALQPRDVAAIVPSSRALQTRLSALPCLRVARTVVEIGPGMGGTTRALLRAIPSSARLLCIEVLPEFVQCLNRIPDSRLAVEEGSAHELESHLQNRGVFDVDVDVVVSDIPFSMMTKAQGRELVEKIHSILTPGGSFVAYQVRDRISELAFDCFGPPQTSLVFWNVPPLRVFQWQKPAPPGADHPD